MFAPPRWFPLAAFFLFRHGPLGGRESALRVPAVAERLGGRAAAAAQRDRAVLLVRLEVVLVAVGVDERDRALDPVGAVLADLYLDVGHACMFAGRATSLSRSPSACPTCRPSPCRCPCRSPRSRPCR